MPGFGPAGKQQPKSCREETALSVEAAVPGGFSIRVSRAAGTPVSTACEAWGDGGLYGNIVATDATKPSQHTENSEIVSQNADIPPELLCHICGYDLRAHPDQGKCPECGAAVAEARRMSAIPLRPAWRNSDPRWRRRMLAGVWILVLLPLMTVLKAFEGTASLRVPNIFGFPGAVRLDETLACSMSVYESLLFCMGTVLLFSTERGRRRDRLDWTRRWGVICTYIVLLLQAAGVLLLCALVLTGIGAAFQTLPLKYQPRVTPFFVNAGTFYLRYGLYPHDVATVVAVEFSSIVMLLACAPLFNAIRSSGPKQLAAILVAPLALFSVMHMAQAFLYWVGIISTATPTDIYLLEVYFRPYLLVQSAAGAAAGFVPSGLMLIGCLVETAKWCIILAIAIWLSIAQGSTWRFKRAGDA
jgi:hypothetical protein